VQNSGVDFPFEEKFEEISSRRIKKKIQIYERNNGKSSAE